MKSFVSFISLVFSMMLIMTEGTAQTAYPPRLFEGPLGHLLQLQSGRAGRSSSADPLRSSNRDMRQILPGSKLVLADIKGAGTIRHIWMTFPAPEPSWLGRDGCANHSELVIRMYWDGAEQPAVESPVGDFFAAGFGKRAAVNSMPVMVEGGDAYNCFWLMPFYKSARIEIENQSEKPSGSFYFQIDYALEDALPPKTPYFCAQYRQEFPVASGRDYLILDAEGEGHYVGTVLSGRASSPRMNWQKESIRDMWSGTMIFLLWLSGTRWGSPNAIQLCLRRRNALYPTSTGSSKEKICCPMPNRPMKNLSSCNLVIIGLALDKSSLTMYAITTVKDIG